MKNKIIINDTDYTHEMNDFYSESTVSLLSTSEIIIGTRYPTNHVYLKVGTVPNIETSTMSVSIWNGKEWKSTVNIVDETYTLSKSGYVTWLKDKDESWGIDNSEDLGLTVIDYDLYWYKISFSADLTPDVNLDWIGEKYSNDDLLGAEYPDLIRSNVKAAFETGKTDWNEQHVHASKLLIKDLISKKLVVDEAQILCREELELACVSKVAEIIFNAMGDDYIDQKIAAFKEYQQRLNKALPKVDKNNNATLDRSEMKVCTGRFYQ